MRFMCYYATCFWKQLVSPPLFSFPSNLDSENQETFIKKTTRNVINTRRYICGICVIILRNMWLDMSKTRVLSFILFIN